MSVKIIDGPFEGADLPYSTAAPASILLEGEGIPEGHVARYRYSTKRHGYVFKGLDRVVLSQPWPPQDQKAA